MKAERGGFEPPVPFLVHSISSAAQSAALPPLLVLEITVLLRSSGCMAPDRLQPAEARNPRRVYVRVSGQTPDPYGSRCCRAEVYHVRPEGQTGETIETLCGLSAVSA